jgi:2-polyprenyl-3-methyl-5-hydroxy-6-metoxy-1,4-benzoquinol methylase
MLLATNAKNVLDIGCGGLGKLFAYIYPFTKDITGVDLPEVAEQLQDVPVGKYVGWDLNQAGLSLGRAFDLIISSDCIEHVLKTEVFLSNLRRQCHEGTIIVLSTPDARSAKNQRVDHKHMWTREDFLAVLSEFEICHTLTVLEPDSKNPYDSTIVVCKVKIN